MYESPIEMFSVTNYVDTISKQIDEQIEEATLSAVTKIGVNVNKEELIKALNYDRRQYEKGYADGKRNGIEWHPYPEEKPSATDAYYLVTTNYGGKLKVMTSWWIDSQYRFGVVEDRVLAWAELPEPYRRENEDGTD